MYTMWLKNKKGEYWDLTSKDFKKEQYGSFLYNLNKFSGASQDIKTTQIDKDFVITQKLPKNTNITGKMIFENIMQKELFMEFLGGFDEKIKLYYDPNGRIYPQTQLQKAWYKEIIITNIGDGLRETNLLAYIADINFSTMSAVWRRDSTIASTVTTVVGEPHIIPFVYPFFYQNESKLYLDLMNIGEKVGCIVKIKNNKSTSIDRCNWSLKSESNKIQYASWLAGVEKLHPGYTLTVDSNPSTQKSIIEKDGVNATNVRKLQEINPQYINFVDLYPGKNQFAFDLGDTNNIDIEVSYVEERYHL